MLGTGARGPLPAKSRILRPCDNFGALIQASPERRLNEVQDHIRFWLAIWGRPELVESLSIEWSVRLYRSLGRSFPSRLLVRLSPALLSAKRELMLEAVCHEVAHVVVPLLHRRSVPAHGPEWAQLIRLAGFQPRIQIPGAEVPAPRRSPKIIGNYGTNRRMYVHSCPVCHMRRVARRRIVRWRCAACVSSGLEGRLVIAATEARSS